MSKIVLVIGNGSREHVISWKLSQSNKVGKIFVAPGNGGIATHGGKIQTVGLNVQNHREVIDWCKSNHIDLVVVGPEDPLSKGLSDSLNQNGVPCFGPSKNASRIESDKAFAKNFMKRYNIPTAKYQNFTDPEQAKSFVRNTGALVIKASGLAAGKGVVVSKNIDEAIAAIDDIMVRKIFGDAGSEIVVEELLEGDEVSVFALTDGSDFQIMLPAQDHKRAFVGDNGPNTGGMGAYCPYPFLESEHMEKIKRDIIERTIAGMKQEGHLFVGLLYCGLMITKNGPMVIEFNCRFGDPETQSVLALLKSDLYDIFESCLSNNIKSVKLEWENKYAVGIVVASGGYPGSVEKNVLINGLEDLHKTDVLVFHSGTAFRDGKYYTNGGRILTIVALHEDLKQAAFRAIKGASLVKINKSFYRNDIGYKAIQRLSTKLDYKVSGVNIDAGNELVEHIKVFAKRTNRPGVMEQIGGFGALFDLKHTGLKDPILVSGTDGVGTKLKIAIETNKLDTVGIDLVAMCVNDILVQGAEPLFFLDYYACNRLNVNDTAKVIKGISDGCELSNAALVGGETAEMPGMYAEGDFDLAGFAVGAVERNMILPDKESLSVNDVIIGVSSSGVHSNGFSLVRKILEVNSMSYDDAVPFATDKTFADVLLTPTRIYVKSILPVIKAHKVKALSHITGGGLIENIPRVLPKHLAVELDCNNYPIPPIFTWLKSAGNVTDHDMLKTFNCGLGMVLVVDPNNVSAVQQLLESNGEIGYVIGKIIAKKNEQVIVHNFNLAVNKNENALFKHVGKARPKKRVAVLISGSGTNLKAIIDYVINNVHKTSIDLALVISDKKTAGGLKFAQDAGIATKVLIKKKEQTRDEYDLAMHQTLLDANIDIVCLAGFMRILSENFVNLWLTKMINIHPALLPSFKGVDAYGQALEAGVKVTGCTAHFVTPEMDAGPIIMQDIVRIHPDDTHDSLVERGKLVEHGIYPKALELVASGSVTMTAEGKLVYNHN